MSKPRVDVLMTVYNGAEHISASLESLSRQTLEEFIIHVVDDGSTDATPGLLQRYAKTENRLRVYSKPNSGVVDSSNFGLRMCTADYVARLDSDDIAAPDRLAKQAAFLDDHQSVIAESGAAYKIGVDGRRLGTRSYSTSPSLSDLSAVPAREPYLLHPFAIFRRMAVETVGGYRRLIVSEDSDLFWRLQEIGDLHASSTMYGEYRMNPESLSSKSIRHGRLMAACSQLVAFSAQRRRQHKPDLSFSEPFSASLSDAAGSLVELHEAASTGMEQDERQHLAACMSMKLIEMADYRPYEVELEDCVFIGRAIQALLATNPPVNAAFIRRSCAGTAARLALHGKRREAEALLSKGMMPQFIARYGSRKLIPQRSFQRLKDVNEEIAKYLDRKRSSRPQS